MNKPPKISIDTFIEILQDEKVTTKDDILIFQTLYNAKTQEMSATEMARNLNWKSNMTVVGKNVSLGRRLEKQYGIIPRMRDDGSKSYWDMFFEGYQEGRFFIFRLRPELKKALEECRMVDDIR